MSDKSASDLLDEDIREEFSKHKSEFRTAKALNINLDRVKSVISREDFKIETREAVYGGQGRPELRRFIVATKHANAEWDNDSMGIKNARALYERGTHEMCQGRDGDTIIQYSIPRATVLPRMGYFTNRSE